MLDSVFKSEYDQSASCEAFRAVLTACVKQPLRFPISFGVRKKAIS